MSESIKTSGLNSVASSQWQPEDQTQGQLYLKFPPDGCAYPWTCSGKYFGTISKKDLSLPWDGSQKKEEELDKACEEPQLL